MTQQQFTIHVQGVMPLLVHSARLSNPLDDVVREIKKISSKKSKTDSDLWEMARLEHWGSLYWTEENGPVIPTDNIWRSLQDAAKKQKLGTAIKQGLIFPEVDARLEYTDAKGKPGPRTGEGLWADPYFRSMDSVKVGMSRVTRTRPIFREWSFQTNGLLDDTLVNWSTFQGIAETAGNLIGLGDWRPKYGRFKATLTKI